MEIEKQPKAERRREVDLIKRLGRDSKSGGFLLRGLWACRIAAGLSQRALATRIGASQGTIHDLETLARGAHPTTVRKLCEALSVEPSDLLSSSATEEE